MDILNSIYKEYDHDYPNEPIGGGNPYYRCVYCKKSDPAINGKLDGHYKDCEYRLKKEAEFLIVI